MQGRNAVPVELNRAHLSIAQKEERKAAEIRVGIPLFFSPPYYLRGNRWALRRFRKLRDEYTVSGVTFITSSDVEFIARYCERWARYRELKKACDKTPIECLKDSLFIEGKLLALNESLISMEKELFLTPQSKFRNVPRKQEKPEQTPLEKAGLKNV
jgi:phage terminase small subunit